MAPAPLKNDSKHVNVVLTGFEPFGSHKTNPSWLSIASLDNTILDLPEFKNDNNENNKEPQYAYITAHELPVEYHKVPTLISALHSQQKAATACAEVGECEAKNVKTYYIHVGVGRASSFTVETLAHRTGYGAPDNASYQPPSKEVPPVEGYEFDPELLETTVDTLELAEYLKQEKGWLCEQSKNAGLYLCEYTFYLSMVERHRRIAAAPNAGTSDRVCLFVHVPTVGNPYSLEEIQQFVRDVIGRVVTMY
ncbi:Pyroglutamyl-peptidase 1 [Basidiobolus ranarum]|uniref:Pyroglutamyl-peptidase 1 n=1 Tax=Basidiobolus ranarum TaxID=34480 RepID=A0ABR2WVT8_9FUNG